MKKPTFPLMAVRFQEANRNLTKPQNMTDEECGSLWVFTDGGTQPPVWMTAAETVFVQSDKG